MDDKTRGIGDRDDVTGWSAETTRNLDTAKSTGSTRSASTRTPTTPATRGTGTKRASTSANEGLDEETDMRTRELQAEIADTRDDMAETIDAIQDRLRPANLVSDATEQVKTAATQKMRDVAESAGDTAHNLMHQTRRGAADMVEGARRNPVPALMIGAGVAWLLMDRSKNSDRNYTQYNVQRQGSWKSWAGGSARSGYEQSPAYGSRYDRSTGAYGTNHVAAGTGVDLTEPQYADVDDRYTNDTAAYGTNRTWGSGGSRNLGNMGNMGAMDNMSETLSRTSRNAQNGLQRLLRDNPLLVGAAAVLVGAAVGAALPETERENQLMGETRDSVVNQAQDMARDAASTVQEVATDAVQKVTDRASEGQ